MKKECLNSPVLADFNLYFLLASRVRESALSRYPFSLIHRRLFLIVYKLLKLIKGKHVRNGTAGLPYILHFTHDVCLID